MSDDRPTAEGRAKYESLRKSADRTHLCNAPVTNLYFRTDGLVEPCWLQIGDGVTNRWSPQNSIMDIWNGRFLSDLRADLAEGKLPGMCLQCKVCIDQGTRPLALAYEDLEPNPGYTYPSMLELELSNQCNLECVMCQGTLSHLIRKNREHLPPLPMAYDESFVEQTRELIPHLKELRFNGGEPFTQQIVFDICEQVYELNPGLRITIATNGTVLNDRVKSHLERGNFHINISIDSLRKERYEAIRIRGNHDVLMSNFEYFKEYCESRDRIISVMVNPMRSNWDEMGEIMEWATAEGVHCWFNVVRYPLHSAIWNLPSGEIEQIIEVLSQHEIVYNPETTRDYIYANNMVAWNHLVGDQLPVWLTEQREREAAGETAHMDTTTPLSLGPTRGASTR
jgi:MoaA/NifB/PqqE/SkfB family radical SAM enzyme